MCNSITMSLLCIKHPSNNIHESLCNVIGVYCTLYSVQWHSSVSLSMSLFSEILRDLYKDIMIYHDGYRV